MLWLDGRPGALRVVRAYSPLLEAQGVRILVPRTLASEPLRSLGAAVVVAPPRGPERPLAEAVAEATGARLVSSQRPRRSLYLSLAHPSGVFREVAVGVDPGESCAAAAVADGLVVWAWRGRCVDMPVEVERLLDDMEALKVRVYVGFGQGGGEAIRLLEPLGYTVSGVPEEGSTSSPYQPPPGLYEALRDEDVLAALTIAFKGLTQW